MPLALVGRSSAARTAMAAFEAASTRRAAVLIEAEAGCCPEEVASALHRRTRSPQPLVSLDCRTDDPLGIEQRLFGGVTRVGEVGDLENATERSAVLASGAGTLFLDHIDELPAAAQRRLARVLRDGEVRVARQTNRTGFRLVAATTHDLENETREGRFRDDLLRRLAKCRITIPALRRRPTDIPEILETLANGSSTRARGAAFTAQAVAVLVSLPWIRNFDELCECVETLGRTADGEVTAEQVLAHVSLRRPFGNLDLTASLREARRQFEREYIAAVLERHRWSMSEAARTLGIERANLYRKARQLGITRGLRESWTVQS